MTEMEQVRRQTVRKPEYFLRWEKQDTVDSLDAGLVHQAPEDAERTNMLKKALVIFLKDSDSSVTLHFDNGDTTLSKEGKKFRFDTPVSNFTTDSKQAGDWLRTKLQGARFTPNK